MSAAVMGTVSVCFPSKVHRTQLKLSVKFIYGNVLTPALFIYLTPVSSVEDTPDIFCVMTCISESTVSPSVKHTVDSRWTQTVQIYCCYANTSGIQGNKLSRVAIVVNYLNCLNKDTMQHSAVLWSTIYLLSPTRKLGSQRLQKDQSKVTTLAHESVSPSSLRFLCQTSNYPSLHTCVFIFILFYFLVSLLISSPSPPPATISLLLPSTTSSDKYRTFFFPPPAKSNQAIRPLRT